MKEIVVYEIVGKNAISMQSGSNLYDLISQSLQKDDQLILNFDGVELFASPFFNASIGFMLRDTSIEQLQGSLQFDNLSKVGKHLLNHVIDNAIKYYSDESSVSEVINRFDENGDNA